MASLFVIKGPDQGRRFELDQSVLTLGREASNQLQVHDTEVSRQHAEIRLDEEGFTLHDLDSSNGTWVNTERQAEVRLKSGDRLQVGRTVMIFTAQSSRPAEDLSEVVDIVEAHRGRDGSQILKTASQEDGSQLFSDAPTGSPWLARARSNLQVMYRTALAVSHTLDIDELLSRILELIFEWVEADRGCVMLLDQDTEELTPKVRRTRRGVNRDERISISSTILDYVMEHQEGVLTSDAKDDQRWDPGGSIVNLGVREAICVPMQGRYGVVGVIYIDTYTPPGRSIQDGADRFHEEHLKLMVAIGHQAALAVEDTSYYSAMVQAERLAAVGQTIAALSHHIKNILQGIRGGSYLIEEGLKSNEPDVVRSGWGIVDRNQEKISNLVLDMLTFSKEREPAQVSAQLNDVAAEVVELMNVRAQEAGVQLDYHPDSDMPLLTFDPEGLHRAMLNIVTNAIDAAGEREQDGLVQLHTRFDEAQHKVFVVVTDNGEGIEPEEQKRIFKMFVSSKGQRGTGLGLPVSQKILREHGGDIRMHSKPGQGSTFTLELPASPAAAPRPTSLEEVTRGDSG